MREGEKGKEYIIVKRFTCIGTPKLHVDHPKETHIYHRKAKSNYGKQTTRRRKIKKVWERDVKTCAYYIAPLSYIKGKRSRKSQEVMHFTFNNSPSPVMQMKALQECRFELFFFPNPFSNPLHFDRKECWTRPLLLSLERGKVVET